jgi:hypothetical protein
LLNGVRAETCTEEVMSTFAPEFAQFWLAGLAAVAVAEAKAGLRDEQADRDKAALEELAERVFAARSVV